MNSLVYDKKNILITYTARVISFGNNVIKMNILILLITLSPKKKEEK